MLQCVSLPKSEKSVWYLLCFEPQACSTEQVNVFW